MIFGVPLSFHDLMLTSPRQAMIVNGFSKLRLRDMAVSGNGENVAYLW